MKIQKIDKNNNKRYDNLSESYIVKFWKKDGEFWVRKEEVFLADKKNRHLEIAEYVEKLYGKDVKVISVTYV